MAKLPVLPLLRILMVLVAAASFNCAGALAAHKTPPAHKVVAEQSHFSAEDKGVRNPVPIPADVWAMLKKDSHTQIYLDDKDPLKAAEIQRSWFSATVVHLRNPSEDDLVVAAEGPLAAGELETWWVFMNTPQGMKLVMTAVTHGLTLLTDRFKGVRMIDVDSMTCCQVTTSSWRYEDGEFRQYSQVSRAIK
jgi:hypothetical protein